MEVEDLGLFSREAGTADAAPRAAPATIVVEVLRKPRRELTWIHHRITPRRDSTGKAAWVHRRPGCRGSRTVWVHQRGSPLIRDRLAPSLFAPSFGAKSRDQATAGGPGPSGMHDQARIGSKQAHQASQERKAPMRGRIMRDVHSGFVALCSVRFCVAVGSPSRSISPRSSASPSTSPPAPMPTARIVRPNRTRRRAGSC